MTAPIRCPRCWFLPAGYSTVCPACKYEHPSYWDEKRRDRREEFKREDAEMRERAYPERRP